MRVDSATCVQREHLGKCTIRLGYASFPITTAFKRVDSTRGPTVSSEAKLQKKTITKSRHER